VSPSSLLFLLVRVTHVFLAAIWIGAAVYTSYFLMPAIAESGPAGGQVMAAVMRRGVTRFLGIVAGTTIVTGIYLYWRFTGGFDPGVSGSRTGMVFGIGGVAGILAGIVGGGVIGRGAGQLQAIGGRLASLGEGPERAALLRQAGAVQRRMAVGGKVLILLQVIALALMAIGHYV
jgi:hypothetical protein